MEQVSKENLLLTIEGVSYTIPFTHWFFYTGKLNTAPDWFTQMIEDEKAIRYPTGVVHCRGIGNGWPTIYPNSIVFMRRFQYGDYIIESIRVDENQTETNTHNT